MVTRLACLWGQGVWHPNKAEWPPGVSDPSMQVWFSQGDLDSARLLGDCNTPWDVPEPVKT